LGRGDSEEREAEGAERRAHPEKMYAGDRREVGLAGLSVRVWAVGWGRVSNGMGWGGGGKGREGEGRRSGEEEGIKGAGAVD